MEQKDKFYRTVSRLRSIHALGTIKNGQVSNAGMKEEEGRLRQVIKDKGKKEIQDENVAVSR